MPGTIFGAGLKDETRERSATDALSWSACISKMESCIHGL